MDNPITPNGILLIFQAIISLVAGVTAIVAIIKWITQIHDRNKKLDGYEEKIAEVQKAIEDLKLDTDAKMQTLRSEQLIITDSILAILEGLSQLDCNGPVTDAKNKLIEFINGRAHEDAF